MIAIDFTETAVNELYTAHLKHPNSRIRRKLLAIYLKSQNLGHGKICKICRITRATLVNYLNEYLSGGIAELCRECYPGHPSKLTSYAEEIRVLFEKAPPATLKEARAKIAKLTGFERSLPQIRAFMRKFGLSIRKVGGIPGKMDPELQESFKKTNSSPGLRKPKTVSG